MLIGIVGYIGSGKDTVSQILVDEHGFKRESFATSLKDACAHIFNWPRYLLEGDTAESRKWREQTDAWWSEKLGIPNFTPRLALQLVGTEAMRQHFHDSIWVLSLQNRLESMNKNIVISDTRFKNEIEALRAINGILIRVDRGTPPVWCSIAEAANKGDADALHTMKTTYSHIHESEWNWAGIVPDCIIKNDGTLEDLKKEVDLVISKIYSKV